MKIRFDKLINYWNYFPVPETNTNIWCGYIVNNKVLIKIK